MIFPLQTPISGNFPGQSSKPHAAECNVHGGKIGKVLPDALTQRALTKSEMLRKLFPSQLIGDLRNMK